MVSVVVFVWAALGFAVALFLGGVVRGGWLTAKGFPARGQRVVSGAAVWSGLLIAGVFMFLGARALLVLGSGVF